MICDRRLKHYLPLSTMDEMAFLLDKMINAGMGSCRQVGLDSVRARTAVRSHRGLPIGASLALVRLKSLPPPFLFFRRQIFNVSGYPPDISTRVFYSAVTFA
jgi:hypothetical protein